MVCRNFIASIYSADWFGLLHIAFFNQITLQQRGAINYSSTFLIHCVHLLDDR